MSKKSKKNNKDIAWEKIFKQYSILENNFSEKPFLITSEDIKNACNKFKETGKKESRILCKYDSKDSRPKIFKDNGLFILPTENGKYYIIKEDGYIDTPKIETEIHEFKSKLKFKLETSDVGDSEMQHIDFAYNNGLIQHFVDDDSIILTIRGRKFTEEFDFIVGKHKINVSSVQTEVDAGYEGKNKVVLIEAKNKSKDIIIRQLYYPYRLWSNKTEKEIITLFFYYNKKEDTYSFWQFGFKDKTDYKSIRLLKSAKYKIL